MHLYFVIMKVITNIHSFTFRFEDLKIEMSFYQGDTFAIKHYRWGFHINVDKFLIETTKEEVLTKKKKTQSVLEVPVSWKPNICLLNE